MSNNIDNNFPYLIKDIDGEKYYFFEGKTCNSWPNSKGLKISKKNNTSTTDSTIDNKNSQKIPLNVLSKITQKKDIFVGFDTNGNIKKGIGFYSQFDNISKDNNSNIKDKKNNSEGIYIKYNNYIPLNDLNIKNKNFDYIPIDIKVINLDRRPDRWKRIIKQSNDMQFEKYNITLNRISACDGNKLKQNPSDYEKKLMSKMKEINPDILKQVNRNKFFRYSEIGCFLSHYQIWMDFLNSDDSSEYLFVIEDDIRFRDNFCHTLQVLMNKIKNIKDSDKKSFNYILLGACFYNNKLNNLRKINKHINNSDYLINPLTVDYWGTFGYILNKNIIKILLNEFELNGCDSPVDCYMRLTSKKHKKLITEIYPNIIETDLIIDTDIHSDINYYTNK